MTSPYNLKPYQYQLGNVVFGRDTDIPISKVEIQTYNINKQDFQIIRTDETRFGIDTLVPGTITFTMAVVENFILEQFAVFEPEDLFPIRGTLLSELAATWKANGVRAIWGSTVPLFFADRNGRVVMIYGRPGKFQYAPKVSDRDQWIDVSAEFRRGDTYAHSALELYVGDATDITKGLAPGAAAVNAARLDGDADSWVRFLLQGPCINPIINYGGNVLQLNVNIAEGVELEVNTYPWTRRIVDTNGYNWRTSLAGDTMYLDQINFPAGTDMDISWTCTGSGPTSALYFLWREAYNII
jgi:hypothetical protein